MQLRMLYNVTQAQRVGILAVVVVFQQSQYFLTSSEDFDNSIIFICVCVCVYADISNSQDQHRWIVLFALKIGKSAHALLSEPQLQAESCL